MTNTKMPKWEQTFLRFIEKNMVLLSILFVSVLALYLRKVAVWWNYAQIIGHFDRHVNHTESSLFYLLLKGSEYLPILPLHSFKWLGGLSDFLLAALCAHIAGGKDNFKKALLYMLCLFSPVVFLRGIVWAMPDSTALCFLLTGYLLYEKAIKPITKLTAKKMMLLIVSILLLSISISLQPCLLPVIIGYGILMGSKDSHLATTVFFSFIGSLMLQSISSLLLGEPILTGIYSQFRFATFHPLTGILFETPGDWLYRMILLFGLPTCVISFLYGARKPSKLTIALAVFVQLFVTVFYSNCLFY